MTLADDVERWRAGRLAALTGPEGWLTLVGLFWLHEGENGVGSDPSCDVVLPQGPPRAGTIEVSSGGDVRARFDAASGVTTDDGAPAGDVALASDASGRPTKLRLGPLVFYVIEREGTLAVRMKDTESPARRTFEGIEHWPVEARWRVDAAFERHGDGSTVRAPAVTGGRQTYRNPGVLRFRIDGSELALQAFQEPDEDDLFIVFGDATNADATFQGGRYLYSRPPDEHGTVVLDFNRAYNPPCVFTPYATCVLPVPENHLPVRIEAGEKRYRGGAHH